MDNQNLKTCNNLRKQEREAERNRYDCELRIKSYERVIIRTDPRDEADYNELLDKLHAEEAKCIYWANQVMDIRFKIFELERSMGIY